MSSEWTPLSPPIDPQFAMGSPGDASGDGTVNEADIDPFIDILLDPTPTEAEIAVADLDGSQSVDEEDFGSLVETMSVMGSGPQWTHSYSAHLIITKYLTGPNAGTIRYITLVRDDGTLDVFNPSGSSFASPPGVFDTLTAGTNDDYFLTTKSQWKVHFVKNPDTPESDMWRRLDYIEDPSSNRVTCSYYSDPFWEKVYGKLYQVTDASGRLIQLTYNDLTGHLIEIAQLPYGRYWKLLYQRQAGDPTDYWCGASVPVGGACQGGSGPFIRLQDPMGFHIDMTYTANAEIATIADKDGDAFSFSYNDRGQLATVTDPAPFNTQVQSFAYDVISGARRTTYTDRRGNPWTMAFEAESWNLIWIKDPLEHVRSIAYDKPGWPYVHEATSFTDPLSRTWSVDYDNAANVTSSTDPLGNQWAYAYTTDGKNNLISVTPPGSTPGTSNADKQVQLYYDDTNHPTSVTRIVEPAADATTTEAETLITYYDLDDQGDVGGVGAWNGLVKKITPPYSTNPVATEFKYDTRGQLRQEREGKPSDITLETIDPVSIDGGFDDAGQPGTSCNGLSCGIPQYDDNGNLIGMECKETSGGQTTSEPPPVPPGQIAEDCWPRGAAQCQTVHPQLKSGVGPYYSSCSNTTIEYTNMGQLTKFQRCAGEITGPSYIRTLEFGYDELGRMQSRSIESDEMTGEQPSGYMHDPIPRGYTYTPSWTQGNYDEQGPDGTHSFASFDVLGRLEYLYRWDAAQVELIGASVSYTDAGEVQTVSYGNGSTTDYVYDDAGRVELIWHFAGDGQDMHLLDYDWSTDALVTTITESDVFGEQAVTVFTYDRRNRLIGEQRTGTNPYHLAYTYDKAGNRLTKADVNLGLVTTYTYDVSDPETYLSQGNRLMHEKSEQGTPPVILSERWYDYNKVGNVTYVVERVEGDTFGSEQWFSGTGLYYTTGGQIWMARRERWRLYSSGTNQGHVNPDTREYISAMEYRYDSPRERYMVRARDPQDLTLPTRTDGTPAVEGGTWHDYAGSSIYADWTVDMSESGGTVTGFAPHEQRAHVPGVAECRRDGNATTYQHGNLIGTTEAVTDEGSGNGGSLAGRAVRTAFGETVSNEGFDTRYGYAGAWEYQAAGSGDPLADLGWLHVGARYYDPASGRFVQRDPIGIRGGGNVYEYTESDPARSIDPEGYDRWIMGGADFGEHQYIVVDAGNGWYLSADFYSTAWASRGKGRWEAFKAGAKALFGGQGLIKVGLTRNRPGAGCVQHITSTPEQDRKAIRWITTFGMRPQVYSAGYNCRTFSGQASRIGMPSIYDEILAD